jgi:hypothetical protein
MAIPTSLARTAILFFSLLTGSGLALADDLSDFNAAVEKAESHNRVAIGYLRTGNVDLAWIEIDRLRDSWGALQRRFAGHRPQAFDGKQYVTAMTDIAVRLITADMMLKSGHPDVARQSLDAIRRDLYDLRKSAGVVVLADCIRDANTAMDALMVYNDRALDWSKAGTRDGVASKASHYAAILDRCDGMANDAVRKAPEFRRLVDGAKASLTLIPKAIATRDGDLLHRVLIELRSFDNLLAFRYG